MNSKKKICFIFGTRPEALKMIPIIKSMESSESLEPVVLLTGQHAELLDEVIDLFNIKVYKNLSVMTPNQSLETLTSRLVTLISDELKIIKPDMVLVHGDTTTSFVGALSAFYCKIKIGHVEAGLRSNDLQSPFPEEMNRVMISNLSDLNFCPTEGSSNNLINQGIDKSKILITGNSIVDTIEMAKKMVNNPNKVFKDTILITTHRRENFDKLESIYKPLVALSNLYANYKFKALVHPNPNIKDKVKNILKGSRIEVLDPVNYLEMTKLLMSSRIVLTDSGGLQEECPSFNCPTLVLRNETERMETVEAGLSYLVGSNEKSIITKFIMMINNPIPITDFINPYGEVGSSNNIVNHIEKYLSA